MKGSGSSRGFTLLELLVVLGVLGLLTAILLPAVQSAREVGKRTACLANLHHIGLAAAAYAADTPGELLIPIHQSMVNPLTPDDYWVHRTAMWFMYGGRSAPAKFLAEWGKVYQFDDSEPGFSAASRPLNPYMFPKGFGSDGPEMRVYACPSDKGYPGSPEIDDSPMDNADNPCWETLGNSYRSSLYGIFPEKGANYDGAFAIGPWGHRTSTIPDASRTVAYGEPMFFNMVGLDNGAPNADPVLVTGWHSRELTDNLLFCDGSVRPTKAAGFESFSGPISPGDLFIMKYVGPNWDLISRGPSWRFDLWPTPGARIWSYNPKDPMWNPPFLGQKHRGQWWPFIGAQKVQ